MTVALPGDKFDPDKYKGMDPIEMMLAIRREFEYSMPPPGVIESRAFFGGYQWVRRTWRCEVPGCYYVCTPRVGDETSLKELQEYHRSGKGDEYACPTPPRRESLPSGLSEIEKLWREIDDVVAAIKAKEKYRGMDAVALNGYVKGLAFSIVMKDKDLWPDMKAVAAHALDRWKMQRKLIPWKATPTRHANNFSSLGAQGGWKKEVSAPTVQTGKTPPIKVSPRLTVEQIKSARAAAESGIFSTAELAEMYKVSEDDIKLVISSGR